MEQSLSVEVNKCFAFVHKTQGYTFQNSIAIFDRPVTAGTSFFTSMYLKCKKDSHMNRLSSSVICWTS